MYKRMPFIKCPRCRCIRDETEYDVYKGIRRKTCLKCKEITKKQREKANKKEPNIIQETTDDNLMQYIRHQKIYRKLLVEYKIAVGHSVHMYNFKAVLSQIKTKMSLI